MRWSDEGQAMPPRKSTVVTLCILGAICLGACCCCTWINDEEYRIAAQGGGHGGGHGGGWHGGAHYFWYGNWASRSAGPVGGGGGGVATSRGGGFGLLHRRVVRTAAAASEVDPCNASPSPLGPIGNAASESVGLSFPHPQHRRTLLGRIRILRLHAGRDRRDRARHLCPQRSLSEGGRAHSAARSLGGLPDSARLRRMDPPKLG